MAELSFFVGVIGTIITVLMFLSPVPTFWRIIKRRCTEEFESLPYICTLLQCSLWTYYGSMKSGEYIVAAVNGFGAVVETAYIILFLVYAPAKMRAKTGILVGILNVGILGVAIIGAQTVLQGEDRINAVGIMGAASKILMSGSPLAAVKAVVMTKSVEYMPFLLSLSLMLNGGVWLLYAILLGDWILGVPNGAGFLLGAIQLVVYGIYRDPRSANKFNQQHHSLIASSSSSQPQPQRTPSSLISMLSVVFLSFLFFFRYMCSVFLSFQLFIIFSNNLASFQPQKKKKNYLMSVVYSGSNVAPWSASRAQIDIDVEGSLHYGPY